MCVSGLTQAVAWVGKSADAVANCAPMADFLLSYKLKIQKPEVGSETAVASQVRATAYTPAPPQTTPLNTGI